MPIASIYARVSTDDQIQGASLEVQEQRCRAEAERLGFTVAGSYSDPGVSGFLDPLSRPGFSAAVANKPDAVFVYDWSRYSRDQPTGELAYRKLFADGITIHSAAEPGEDPFIRTIHLAVAERYRRELLVKSMAGRLHRVREGRWVGGRAPFGFKVEEHKLVVEPDEAVVVRRAAELILAGENAVTAAAVLNDEGLRPRFNPDYKVRQRPNWSPNSLRHCLRDTALRGRFVYRLGTGEAIEQEHPAILDRDTFERVQAALASRQARPQRWREYPLSKRLVMPCGSYATGRTGGNKSQETLYAYYRCVHAGKGCGCKMVPAGEVEAVVASALLLHLKDPSNFYSQQQQTPQAAGSQAVEIEAQLLQNERNIDNALEQRVCRPELASRADKLLDDLTVKRQTLDERLAAARLLDASEAARGATAQKLRRLSATVKLGAEDYAALGLRVTVLDFKTLRVRIEGAINVTVDADSFDAPEQSFADEHWRDNVESSDDVLTFCDA